MKKLLGVWKSVPYWLRLVMAVILIAWALLTLSLAQNWKNVDDVIDWVKSQTSLGLIASLIQISILISVWYKQGGINMMIQLYQKDTTANFRRMDRDQRVQDSNANNTAQRVSKLEGEVEVIKDILFNNNQSKDGK